MKIVERNLLIINILLIIYVFFVPNNSSYYFDGLPFTNKYETIFFTIFFPFFLFFYNFIKSRKILLLLIVISIFKIILISAPPSGANVKQYFTYNDYKNDNYIKTFDTFWNKNISARQLFPWKNKNNFPMDWTHLSKINKKTDTNARKIELYEDFENISMFYKFDFFLFITENSKIDFLSNNGSNIINSKIKVWNENLNQFNEIKKDLKNKETIFDIGLYYIEITLNYDEKKWKFDPLILEDNRSVSLFEKRIIFSDLKYDKINITFLSLFNKIGYFYDYLIILLIILILHEIYILYLKKSKLPIFLSVIFILSYFFLDKIINFYFSKINIVDGVGSFSFAFTNILLFLLFISIKLKKYKNLDLTNTFVLSSVLVCLFVFFKIFSFELESFSWAGSGDDWTTFQEYSRQIVIDNDWLIAGEKIFYFRPGSRYIYAISHIIFGMSGFAYKMLNIWSVIICSFLIIKILIRLNCNHCLSFLSGALLLSIYTGDNFRWLLLVGLSEYYAMLCMIVSIYLIIGNDKINLYKYFSIILLGITQVWLREDHLPIAIATIYALYTNFGKKLSNTNNLSYIKIFFLITKKNFLHIFIYSSLILFGFALIFIRNYYTGGSMGLTNIFLVKKAFETFTKPETLLVIYWDVFSRLIFGVDQYFPTYPRPYSIFNIFAIAITILTILKYNKFKYINFSLPILLISILFPYFFFENEAYTPRYAIHFLPISILVCSQYFNKFLKI